MLQKQPFLPYFKQLGFVCKYKLIAVHQRYEAAAISLRKGLFKCRMHDTEGYSININNLNVLSSNPHGGKKVSSFTTNVSFKLVRSRPSKRN